MFLCRPTYDWNQILPLEHTDMHFIETYIQILGKISSIDIGFLRVTIIAMSKVHVFENHVSAEFIFKHF